MHFTNMKQSSRNSFKVKRNHSVKPKVTLQRTHSGMNQSATFPSHSFMKMRFQLMILRNQDSEKLTSLYLHQLLSHLMGLLLRSRTKSLTKARTIWARQSGNTTTQNLINPSLTRAETNTMTSCAPASTDTMMFQQNSLFTKVKMMVLKWLLIRKKATKRMNSHGVSTPTFLSHFTMRLELIRMMPWGLSWIDMMIIPIHHLSKKVSRGR